MNDNKLNKLANTSSPILLTGETGTGKSYLAHQLHMQSNQIKSKFIEVNLATISDTLIESEIFGHCKGAFTGATESRNGYCWEVGSGTLFLDEVGELSLNSQKKLLLLLEKRVYTPVGTCKKHKFNGRIIAATNKNLKEMVNNGEFRADLYYRLAVFSHYLQPLRDSTRSINAMLSYYLDQFNNSNDLKLSFSRSCLNVLFSYHWPGNIRELKNCVEYTTAFSEKTIKISDLPSWMNIQNSILNINLNTKSPDNYYIALQQFEKNYLKTVLKYYGGKINFSAKQMNISKSTLIAKIRKYGINHLMIKANHNSSGTI